MVKFLYDVSDTRRIPGLARSWDGDAPFLTPVFFRHEVLIRYFHEPQYECRFASETYGHVTASDGAYSMPFGINRSDRVVVWLGDIQGIPANDQRYWKLYNIASDHDIESDFYQAQINIDYGSDITEIELLLLKNKVSHAAHARFGVHLYRDHANLHLAPVQKLCARYKRLRYNSWDDLKVFTSEWNESLVEDINIQGLRHCLQEQGHVFDENYGSLKLMELFLSSVVGDSSNAVAPLFWLYDLRIWADHRGSESKLCRVLGELGLPATAEPRAIYRALINALRGTMKILLRLVVNE